MGVRNPFMKDPLRLSAPKKAGWNAITNACSRLLRRLTVLCRLPVNRRLPPVPLPGEIWMQIIQEHCRKHEWVALSRTCWFFHQIARTCLYERLLLCKSDNLKVANSHIGHTMFLFRRSLEKNPDLGAFVRELSLYAHFLSSEGRGLYLAHSLLFKPNQFPRLETLRLENVHIDADLCYALHSHARLTVVDFLDCTLDDSLTAMRSQSFPGSSVSKVNILSPGPVREAGIWVALAPAGLRSFTASSTFQPSDLDLVLSAIMISGKNHMLDTLSIDFACDCLVEFLISSPKLRHLALLHSNHPIGYVRLTNSLTFSSLPMDALPLLEQYSGPTEFSELLLRNRPVHNVGLRSHSNTVTSHYTPIYINAFVSLRLSSVPVTHLELWGILMGTWSWHLPTTIRRLTFHNLDKEEFMNWMPALSQLTNLLTIHWKVFLATKNILSWHEATEISKTCPSLRKICTGHQRWLVVSPNVLECLFEE